MEPLAEIAAEHGLLIVEDCAQAHGASDRGRRAGTTGIAAAWSFYPTKNLGGLGDGGAVTTDSADVAERLRRLRNYGQRNRYEHEERGFNSRLDPLQAALLSVKLPHLAQDNERRRMLAVRYLEGLDGSIPVRPLRVLPGALPSRHLFPVVARSAQERQSLQDALASRGVETLIHYPIAMPDQRATAPEWVRGEYPNARQLCQSLVSLPLYPELELDEVDAVLAAIRNWARG